ncbi:condensin-2 complex subunit D3 isoform X3 [Esox lucius]|uniref:condensin-2 complex subunit D3 isoform X3 n=1 Tax=Esox lucius TaxID=8010 RepID=UPI00147710AF|nr:condensin-2 complex subunit D3 isoform X3 [Esox lucius]
MELIHALEFLKLKEVSVGWVDAVWDFEFTETEPLDAAIAIKNGSVEFQTLYNRLIPYVTDTEGTDAASPSVWTVFGDNGISVKSLVAVLSYFVLGGKSHTANAQQRINALQAASLYLLLLGIPGSVVNKVFHQILFDTCLNTVSHCWPQSSVKKRKKDPLKSSQGDGKRSKPHRKDNDRDNDEMEIDEDEEQEEEVHLSPQDLLKMREGVVLLVKSVLHLLLKFPLKDEPLSAENCVQMFAKLTDFEPVIGELTFGARQEIDGMKSLPQLAYYGLWLLCSPSHGDEKGSLSRVFHRILYVILMMDKRDSGQPSLMMPTQAVLAARDQAVHFVCHIVDELKEPALPVLRILLQHICFRMVDKTDYRMHGAQAVARLLTKMPCAGYASFIKWLFDYSRHAKVTYRMFALDIAMVLLEQPEREGDENLAPELVSFLPHKFLVHNMVFGRRSDTSPTVRGHALTCLAQCLELPSMNATRCVKELFSTTSAQTVLESDGSNGSLNSQTTQKTFKTLPFKTIEITNNENASFESKETMALLKCRVSDPKTNVRKSALQAITGLLKHNVIMLSEVTLAVLSERTRDPALSVKKKALQCLMDLLASHPESNMVQKAWLRGVVPAMVDTESSVQEKALECLEQTILSQVKSHSSYSYRDAHQTLTWDLLGLLCNDCQDLSRYFSRAFTVWSKQNKFTEAFINNLISHTEAEHAAGAWLLLSKVASSCPLFDYGKILDAWDDLVRSKNFTVTTSCHILCVIGDICEHLNEDTKCRIVEDIMTWLKIFDMPLEVISASVETLCRLGKAETIVDTQKFLNEHCGELVSLCEVYLSGVILNENGAENLNEDLVVKHLYTLGVVSLHCPSKVGKRIVILVQSVLTSNVDVHTEASEELAGSQPLTQFKPSSMPSTVRAHAVVTLGKFCLQHEELTRKYLPAFARELEMCRELAVRSNVVVVMCDLCMRYTNMVDRYVPNVSACLRDKEPLIRKQTLTMLTNLLQEEFVKWKGSLFFRFVTALVDPDPSIASLCEYCLVHQLLKKNPVMFSQHFIECIFHFNSYEKHNTYNKFPQTDSERAKFSLKGAQNKEKRFRIYRFLLENFTDAQRFNITIKICQNILACFVDGELLLDADGAAVLGETFGILSLKEIKLSALSGAAGLGGDEPQEDEQMAMAKAVMEVAQKKAISQVQKKVFIESMIPIIIHLKSILEQKRSPVLKDLMGYLQLTMQDYRGEVKEFFAADEQLAAELEYNLKMYEKELETEAQMAHGSIGGEASSGGLPVVGSPAADKRFLPTGFATPQPVVPSHRGLLTPRLSQSDRRLPPQQRSWVRATSDRVCTTLSGSVKPKGAINDRAISTPQGNVNEVTFGEGVSAIFSDRGTGSKMGDEGCVLHLMSPEQQTPVPKQWNVQSPLNQKRSRRIQK